MTMSPRQLFLIFLIHGYQCIINTYHKELGVNGEDIWKSDTDFIPINSTSFGTLKLGQVMSAEFDFVWKGRTNNPRPGYYENFFRVGFDATVSEGCAGQGARYPSFWLSNDEDTMHVSVSSGSNNCYAPQSLRDYGAIAVNVSYHILIAFNNTNTTVQVTGGGKAHWENTWHREPVDNGEYIGQYAPVWFNSNKNSGTRYNLGAGVFSNIIFVSSVFQPTTAPTADPTHVPTATPSSSPTTTASPSSNPSTSPTTGTPTSSPTTTASPSTGTPTLNPSVSSTIAPSLPPTTNPTTTTTTTRTPTAATSTPTMHTTNPSLEPSHAPSANPIAAIPTTHEPSSAPSTNPSTHPSSQPTTSPSQLPTTTIPTSTPSKNPTDQPSEEPSTTPTNNPTEIPSNLPTTQPSITPSRTPSYSTDVPSFNPSFSPTDKPTANPTLEPTKNPIKPTWIPDNTWFQQETTADSIQQDPDFWNQNPYTYIFYSAMFFVALILLVMAIGCYCKFKPPSNEDLGVKYDYDVTSRSYVPQSQGATVIHRAERNEGYGAAKRLNNRAERVHVNTHSHHILTESVTIPSEDIVIGGNPQLRGETTGSQTSDEDVLKGAYGGHITAGADVLDEPFPRDKLRTINDDHVISPHNANRTGYTGIVKPIDMQSRDSSDRGFDYSEEADYHHEDDYFEEEEYEDNVYDDYEDDDVEEEEDEEDHRLTIGAPVGYIHNRHHVDGDEQYIVEMITKDELERKMVTDRRRNKAEKDVQYVQNMYNHQKHESQVMDDVIHGMNRDYVDDDVYGYHE